MKEFNVPPAALESRNGDNDVIHLIAPAHKVQYVISEEI